MSDLSDRLRELRACNESVEWASRYETLQEAWAACERADWMLWLVAKIDGTYSPRLRLAACACARTAEHEREAAEAAREDALRSMADLVRGVIPTVE